MLMSDLKYRNRGKIKELNCKDSTKKRLMDMGLTKGAEVVMKGNAPLGDPMLFDLRGFLIAIRRDDAKYIIVE